MKIVYRLPKVPMFQRPPDVETEGSPPEPGEIVIVGTCTYVVERRTWLLRDGEYKACINLKFKEPPKETLASNPMMPVVMITVAGLLAFFLYFGFIRSWIQ